MSTLLATNDGWHHDGLFFLWPLAWLIAIVAFFTFDRLFLWRGRRGLAACRTPDARAILAERYARGEIGVEEYRERLGNLER